MKSECGPCSCLAGEEQTTVSRTLGTSTFPGRYMSGGRGMELTLFAPCVTQGIMPPVLERLPATCAWLAAFQSQRAQMNVFCAVLEPTPLRMERVCSRVVRPGTTTPMQPHYPAKNAFRGSTAWNLRAPARSALLSTAEMQQASLSVKRVLLGFTLRFLATLLVTRVHKAHVVVPLLPLCAISARQGSTLEAGTAPRARTAALARSRMAWA